MTNASVGFYFAASLGVHRRKVTITACPSSSKHRATHSLRVEDSTMMGVSCEQAARELADAGADVIGANCGIGIEAYVPICAALSSATDLPIWIKANAGLPVIEGGQAVYRMTPEEFAGHLAPLLDAGASFVGGCCGTNPAVITALRDALGR